MKNTEANNKSLINEAESAFEEFFTEYYTKNHNLQSISYFKMDNGAGYSAEIKYKDFTQYVNFYKLNPVLGNG